MSITKKEQQTIEYYKKNAEKWVNKNGLDSEKKSSWKKELKLFQSYLPSGKILEIGFGGGKEAKRLIEAGYSYTGIDASEELVKIVQERLPQGTFLSKNIYDLDFPEASFDGFWCAAVLLHIPKSNIDLALQNIKKAMKPGAIGFISIADGEGESYHEKTGRWFYHYSADEFSKILRETGFHIKKQGDFQKNTKIDKDNPISRFTIKWLTFFVQT